MSVRAKKFRPPLKASAETRTSWLSPSLSSAPNSQASGGDSLPATQTHTVLSYCENYQDEEHSESFEDHSPTSSVSQESEAEIEVASRFKRHKPYPLPKTYGYRTEQHKKKTVADLERSLGKGRVRISLPVAGVGQKPCGSNLSVYDCQPTPPESVGVVSRDITLSLKSKEEQVSYIIMNYVIYYIMITCNDTCQRHIL